MAYHVDQVDLMHINHVQLCFSYTQAIAHCKMEYIYIIFGMTIKYSFF